MSSASVIAPPFQRRAHRHCCGFTLIEMMAVLVLFGLLTAVIAPNFERWFTNTQLRVGASELAVRLQQLHARAALLGQDYELNAMTAKLPLADGHLALTLPDGWSFSDDQSLIVRASGLCSAATVEFKSATQHIALDIGESNCEVSIRVLPKRQP